MSPVTITHARDGVGYEVWLRMVFDGVVMDFGPRFHSTPEEAAVDACAWWPDAYWTGGPAELELPPDTERIVWHEDVVTRAEDVQAALEDLR